MRVLGFLFPIHPFSKHNYFVRAPAKSSVPDYRAKCSQHLFLIDRLVYRNQILQWKIHARLNLYRRRVAMKITALFEMSA